MKEDNSQVPANDKTHELPEKDVAKTTEQNTGGENEQDKGEHKELKHSSAASIDAIITSPTDAVRSRRHTDTLGNTGNNTSYEGATSNAGGGTGYNSGQPATGETIHTNSGYEAAGVGHKKNTDQENGTKKDEQINEDEEKDIV